MTYPDIAGASLVTEPICISALDDDLYKNSMRQTVWHRFPHVNAKFAFKCRTPDIDLLPYKDEIEYEINHLCTLTYTQEELDYMRQKLRYLHPGYIDALDRFQLPRGDIHIGDNGQLSIEANGNWFQDMGFEIPVLYIVNEVYFRHQGDGTPQEAQQRLNEKIGWLKRYSDPFNISDFGGRRRHSRVWHERVVSELAVCAPKWFQGTSNLYLAKKLKLKAYGTMAHEYLQAMQALAPLHKFQQVALQNWADEFDGNLGIALSDVVGMDAFLRDFSLKYAKLFDGCRHDSGDPYVWGEKLIAHYERLGIDPRTKTAVFSDGLNIPSAIALNWYFRTRIRTAFGIGTNLTNDTVHRPLNIVFKMTECDGQPVAKLSDSYGKSMCQDEVYSAYLKKCFAGPEAHYPDDVMTKRYECADNFRAQYHGSGPGYNAILNELEGTG